MAQLSKPRGPRGAVEQLSKKQKEQVVRICQIKATSTQGICIALGMHRSERQIAQTKKDLQAIPEIEYSPAWGGWRSKMRHRWAPQTVAPTWAGFAAEAPEPESEPEPEPEPETETELAKKLSGEVRKQTAVAIRRLIRDEGPRVPARRIREAFGAVGLAVAASHRSFREQSEGGEVFYLSERRVQRRPPEEGELKKLLESLPAAIAKHWCEREGSLPQILKRYAQMHNLSDPTGSDSAWNAVLDHLDKHHPGWRGFQVRYPDDKLG